MEHRTRRRNDCEQGGARSQLPVVRGAEDLVRRVPLDGEHRLGALRQPRPQHRVLQVRFGFLAGRDRVLPRGGTVTQPRKLGEDVPHPVRPFPAGSDLGQRLVVAVPLRLDEQVQIVRVFAGRQFSASMAMNGASRG